VDLKFLNGAGIMMAAAYSVHCAESGEQRAESRQQTADTGQSEVLTSLVQSRAAVNGLYRLKGGAVEDKYCTVLTTRHAGKSQLITNLPGPGLRSPLFSASVVDWTGSLVLWYSTVLCALQPL
jgi:hypothetical protein